MNCSFVPPEKFWKNQASQKKQIRYLFAGDLLAQGIATSYGIMELQIPLFGLYGACSTCGESLALASMCYQRRLCRLCHGTDFQSLCQCRKRISLSPGICRTASLVNYLDGYRFRSLPVILPFYRGTPLYHSCSLLYQLELPPERLVDYGVKDSMHMGAAMAPAAADTIRQHLNDTGRDVSKDYDRIITGDLGSVGPDYFKGSPVMDRGIDAWGPS